MWNLPLLTRLSWVGCLLACLAFAPDAQGLTIELGSVSAGDIVGDQRIVHSVGVPTAFSDTWNFSLTDDLLTGVVVDVQTPTPLVALSFDSVISADFMFDEVEPGAAYVFLGGLPAGDYSFDVTGTTEGALGGAYQVTVGAIVPEPGAASLLCLALLLGAAARRRLG